MSDGATGGTEIVTAAWVAPMDGATPPIARGAVAFEAGRIVAVGTDAAVTEAFPRAQRTDLGNVVVLPGLVNSHVHLDLTHVSRPAARPASFVDWVRDVIRQSMQGAADPSRWVEAAKTGVEQCRRFGVTSVGDIAGRHVRAVREAVAAAGSLRITSFGEVTAMATRRGMLDERVAAAVDAVAGVRTGISPHAPYSIETSGYRRCLEVAQHLGLPLATHLAETPYEREFLESHAGPLRELWEWLKGWDEHVPTFAGGPIRYAKSLGLLDYPTVLAHVNYCDDADLNVLARGRASVVYCPRTHDYFGHPPHRWREMLARGINVALGTDSCASSPDLNLMEDARLVHRLAPDVPPEAVLEMVTLRGARAIGDQSVGTLAAGKWADLVAFPIATDQPLHELLERDALPAYACVGGRWTLVS